MRRFMRILCPVDFSDESRHAVDHAAMFARWYGASLTGLFVYTPIFAPVPGPEDALGVPAAIETIDRQQYERDIVSFVKRSDVAGIDICPRVVVGRVAPEIIKAAGRFACDLVIMGTHGTSGWPRLMIGSVAEAVLRGCRVPVLTVPPRARATSRLPFKRVLCAVDFSDASKAALASAYSIAEEGEADVTVLHVLEAPESDVARASRPFTVPEYHAERERQALEQLQVLITGDARDWCRPLARIGHGRPGDEILRIAAEEQSDLIVIGVNGRSALSLLLLGSTTNQVVRRSTCPVLTLRS